MVSELGQKHWKLERSLVKFCIAPKSLKEGTHYALEVVELKETRPRA